MKINLYHGFYNSETNYHDNRNEEDPGSWITSHINDNDCDCNNLNLDLDRDRKSIWYLTLETDGIKVNEYDSCVLNKIVLEKQHVRTYVRARRPVNRADEKVPESETESDWLDLPRTLVNCSDWDLSWRDSWVIFSFTFLYYFIRTSYRSSSPNVCTHELFFPDNLVEVAKSYWSTMIPSVSGFEGTVLSRLSEGCCSHSHSYRQSQSVISEIRSDLIWIQDPGSPSFSLPW